MVAETEVADLQKQLYASLPNKENDSGHDGLDLPPEVVEGKEELRNMFESAPSENTRSSCRIRPSLVPTVLLPLVSISLCQVVNQT